MKKFLYKNILLYSSHQWCGDMEEYFAKNSEKFAVFLLMPRIKTDQNILRIYNKGKLTKVEKTPLTDNFFLYYFLWYFHYVVAIFKHFPRNEKLIVISAHPYVFFATTIQKLFRRIDFVYYIADYFPPITLTLRLYEKLKKFYHHGIKYKIYLGDGVNKIMNGEVVNSENCKTIMLGVKPKKIRRSLKQAGNTILFVGVIRPNVGLEIVYEFLKTHPTYNIKVVGICDQPLYKKHLDMIRRYKIKSQVNFPNRFFFDKELTEVSKKCFVGVALYEIDDTSTIYYADPGKVKTYSMLGIPVIMSKTSSIVPYVKKFKSGKVIDRNAPTLALAVKEIKKNYSIYKKGVDKMNEHFYFQRYYQEKFKFLEKAFSDK